MRQFSVHAFNQLLDQYSDDPCLVLLTLSHLKWETIRLVNNLEKITSRGQEFQPLAFQITLPGDDGESVPTVGITLDNVDLGLMREFRMITDSPSIKLELIFASFPDVVEMEVNDLKLDNVTYDSGQIKGTLTFDNLLNTKIPSDTYTPKDFPGMF